MAVNPNEYTSPTAGTIKLGTKSLAGTEGIDVLTGNTSEVDPQSYYRTILPQQPSRDSTAQAMTNVGAELFAANTTYRSIFDTYTNVEGGLRNVGGEGTLKAIYPEPKKPDDPPEVPPPSTTLVEDYGYMDPGSYGLPTDPGGAEDPLGYDPAQTFDVTQGESTGNDLNIQVDGRNATIPETLEGMQGAAQTLGKFASKGFPATIIATLGSNIWNSLTKGDKPSSKPFDILEQVEKIFTKDDKPEASKELNVVPPQPPEVTARVAAARAARVADAQSGGYDPFDPPDPPSVSDQSTAAPGTEGPDFFASGGTVKAKAKKVPSFMDSK